MTKQNIKVAIFVILGFLLFWLIMFSFIKIDITTTALVTFDDAEAFMSIDSKEAAYIEKHEIEYIKLQHEKQFFKCHITYIKSTDAHYEYLIILPEIILTEEQYNFYNIIIDSLNIYQYILKK